MTSTPEPRFGPEKNERERARKWTILKKNKGERESMGQENSRRERRERGSGGGRYQVTVGIKGHPNQVFKKLM